MKLFYLLLLLPYVALSHVDEPQIKNAVQYPGCQAEKELTDLLRADYHAHLSTYYQNREKAGFMALERFELALTRAIGDIRDLAYIKDTPLRLQKALDAYHNWTLAFKRAQIKSVSQ